MRVSILPFVTAFASFALVRGATNQTQLQNALHLIQQMPECARTCLLATIAASGISASSLDIQASCNNKTAALSTEECVVHGCGIRQQLAAKNITETLCERPVRDAPNVSVASLIGGTFALVSYILRMASKIEFPCDKGARVDATLWWDDLTISIGVLIIIPITVLSNVLAGLGMGRDIWTVTPDNITQILKVFYYDELLYIVALPIIKIAVCCTYLRIFSQSLFRKLVFVAMGLNVAYAVAFMVVTVFQCTPINLAWLQWDQEHVGICRDINAQSWASAAINIALDILVVVLPMPVLWQLNLNSRKKLLVMLMFGVGFFVTFVSIIRLHLLVKFGDSKNITVDYKQVGYWTVIEVDTAMCCACMPGIRNLLRRPFPRAMGQTTMGGSSGRATPGFSHGLSGNTAVNSGHDKGAVDVLWRPSHSDDGEFVPLEEAPTKDGTSFNVTQPVTPIPPCDSLIPGRFGTPDEAATIERPVSPLEPWEKEQEDIPGRPISPWPLPAGYH